MDKAEFSKRLRLAVDEIHEQYNNLQGIFFYGSFIKSVSNPHDIDILPVLLKRESERENPWQRGSELVKEYFTKYFPNFTQPKVITNQGLNGRIDYVWIDNILHAGYGVVYLEEPDDLRQKVKNLGTGLEHFIGVAEGIQRMNDILR